MFVGHLAVGYGAKKVFPNTSLGLWVAAALFIDLLWPVLLLLRVESVSIVPNHTAFTPLRFDHYPWSHSLMMVSVWGVIWGLLCSFFFRNIKIGLTAGVVVLSHWTLDVLTHAPDLPIGLNGPFIGLGLWNSVLMTILIEGLMFFTAVVCYVRTTEPFDRIGTWAHASFVVFCSLIWISQPWAPLPPNSSSIALVGLASSLLPLWAAWFDRHREPKQ